MTVNINFAGGPPTVSAGADVSGYMWGGGGIAGICGGTSGRCSGADMRSTQYQPYQLWGSSVAALCGGTQGRCSGADMRSGMINRGVAY